MQLGHFSIENLRLATGSVGEGRNFLFLHGLCGDAAQPIEVFPTEAGWRCHALESRGHGRSDIGEPADLSISRFAEDAALFVDTLDGPPPVIGGISMGAAIALRLAATRPGLAGGLVLARPAWVDEAAPSTLAPHREIAALMAAHEPAEAKRRFETSDTARLLAAESPDNLASLLGFFDRRPVEQTQALLAAIANGGPGVDRPAIAAIDLPTLIIGTDRDFVHPLSMAEELASLIPAAALARIPAKSDNREEHVTGFRRALHRFLKEIQ
ncbi:MAG: alpha/beta fold hydrolase [Pseudomonadota bacterium]|nr:alpha/beta fold hydrolase [Pseudomonadota bacterium]MEE3025601.1 alpha/beta fold hydrolase [Pseudomonadota bacterium]